MKVYISILIGIVSLIGCSSTVSNENHDSAEYSINGIPQLESQMSVDEFITAIKSGKSITDLRNKLGFPIHRSLLTQYYLLDGCVILYNLGVLNIRRNGTDDIIVIQLTKPVD